MEPLNRYLDAAVLKPEMTEEEATIAIKKCIELETFSACVRPCDVTLAKDLCNGTSTLVCVVLGFPHGCQLPESKADEAKRYIAHGVDEIDMVANYSWVKSGNWDAVKDDIAGVARLTKESGTLLKVIFESAHLDSSQIETLTEICIEAGADYVKTSTGFNGEGAKIEDVQIMLTTARGRAKVKPSGGIRDATSAEHFINMGAERLGVGWSSCEAIINGAKVEGTGY